MSTSLLVLVPVALLFIVSGLCFVGCALDTTGHDYDPNKPDDPDHPKPPEEKPFTKYSDTDVIGNPNCVAYWPLNDSTMQTTALDVVGKLKNDPHHGEYKSNTNYKDLFPCPDYTVDPAAPVDSAFAPGDLMLGVTGIVAGDTNPPYDDPAARTDAMTVNGAFVNVPANSVTNPPVFTVEFWARPEWDPATAKAAYRTVVDSRDQGGGQFFGYAIYVSQAGNWEAQLGATGMGNFIVVPADQALPEATHVVLRFDGAKAALFINGTPSPDVSLPPATSFAPNFVRPLVIGVGAPYLDERQNSIGDNFFPLFPFNGTIQCVAIYNDALSDAVIQTHFDHGSGKPDAAP